jgi:hypothetical protein
MIPHRRMLANSYPSGVELYTAAEVSISVELIARHRRTLQIPDIELSPHQRVGLLVESLPTMTIEPITQLGRQVRDRILHSCQSRPSLLAHS